MKKIDYNENINYLASLYKKSRMEIEEENKEKKESYMLDKNLEFINYMDTVLGLMPFEYERIIRKDFLENRTVKWWQEFYSKSTYYRRKREAVEAFVDCLSL